MPYIPPGLELLTQQMYGDYENDPSGSPMGIATGQRKSLQDTIDAIYSNYKPEHRFSDQLAQMLSTYPTRTEPSRTQRILSGIASLQPHAQAVVGGQPVGYTATDPNQFQQAQEQFNYAPFYRSMNDWMNKVKPIEEGARDERYLNTNARSLLGMEARSAVSANRADTAAMEAESKDTARKAKTQNDELRTQIAKQRADTYAYIQTLKLPDAEKIKRTEEYKEKFARLDRALQLGNTLEINRAKAELDKALIELRGQTQIEVNENKPGAANKTELPTQTRVRQLNAARELFNTRPDLRPFIGIGSDGVTIVPPSEGIFGHSGPSKEQFDEINQRIYGQTAPTKPITNAPTNKPTPTTAAKPSGRRVEVVDQKGDHFSLPEEQVEIAKSKGYTIVGPVK